MKLRYPLALTLGLVAGCMVASGCHQKPQEPANTRMRRAILARDVEGVIQSIRDGGRVNVALDNEGDDIVQLIPGTSPTPLLAAVIHQEPDIVKVLLDAGADPNLIPLKGMAPLHLAVQGADTTITRLLLEHKANPNLQAKIPGYNPTPLSWAGGAQARPEQVELLLKWGANPNLVDSANECAMNYVGTPPTHSKTWQLLLKAGGKPRRVARLSEPFSKKQ